MKTRHSFNIIRNIFWNIKANAAGSDFPIFCRFLHEFTEKSEHLFFIKFLSGIPRECHSHVKCDILDMKFSITMNISWDSYHPNISEFMAKFMNLLHEFGNEMFFEYSLIKLTLCIDYGEGGAPMINPSICGVDCSYMYITISYLSAYGIHAHIFEIAIWPAARQLQYFNEKKKYRQQLKQSSNSIIMNGNESYFIDVSLRTAFGFYDEILRACFNRIPVKWQIKSPNSYMYEIYENKQNRM